MLNDRLGKKFLIRLRIKQNHRLLTVIETLNL